MSADRAAWAAAVARIPLGVVGRTVASQLGDRADRRGRVRATAAELASCTALPVTAVFAALADLCSRGLLGRADRALVLVVPQGGDG